MRGSRSRTWPRAAAALMAAGCLGGCTTVLGYPERELDPHLQCSDGKCTCEGGFADCDGKPETGCEADLASDKHNCGACGHDCLGGDCAASACQPATIQLSAFGASSFAFSGTTIYFADSTTFAPVGKADASLEDPAAVERSAKPIIPMSPTMPPFQAEYVALSSGSVFFAEDGVPPYCDGSIWATTTGGAPPTMIANDPMLTGKLRAASDKVYWESGLTTLMRVPAAGGATEQVSTTAVLAFVTDATHCYWSDGSSVYRVPHDALTTTKLLDFPKPISPVLQIDPTNLYYADYEGKSGIWSVPLAGGPPVQLVPPSLSLPLALASDGAALYWADQNDTAIHELAFGATTSTVLAHTDGFDSDMQIVVEGPGVYWNGPDSLFRRLAK